MSSKTYTQDHKTIATHTYTHKIYTVSTNGKIWEKGDMRRLYITLDLEEQGRNYKDISNTCARLLLDVKFFVDVVTGEAKYSHKLDPKDHRKIRGYIDGVLCATKTLYDRILHPEAVVEAPEAGETHHEQQDIHTIPKTF